MIKINWINLKNVLTYQIPNLAPPYNMSELEDYYNKGHSKLSKDFEDYLTHVSKEIIDINKQTHLFNLSGDNITSKTHTLQIYFGINISNASPIDIIKMCNKEHFDIDIQNSIISENMILLFKKNNIFGLGYCNFNKHNIAHTSFSSYLQNYVKQTSQKVKYIPFSLHPESYGPSGHYNISKLDSFSFQI